MIPTLQFVSDTEYLGLLFNHWNNGNIITNLKHFFSKTLLSNLDNCIVGYPRIQDFGFTYQKNSGGSSPLYWIQVVSEHDVMRSRELDLSLFELELIKKNIWCIRVVDVTTHNNQYKAIYSLMFIFGQIFLIQSIYLVTLRI